MMRHGIPRLVSVLIWLSIACRDYYVKPVIRGALLNSRYTLQHARINRDCCGWILPV